MTISFDDTEGPHSYLALGANLGFIDTDNKFWETAWAFIENVKNTVAAAAPELWSQIQKDTVLLALRLKFGVHIDIRNRLLATGDEKIVYVSDNRKWGVRRKGKGKNLLGKLLMQVREEFRGPWCDLQPWTPFQEVKIEIKDDDTLKTFYEHQDAKMFVNSKYQVIVEEFSSPAFATKGTVTGLSIKRLDREPIRDWRDMQRIKNELTNPQREACELYPDERRLVDTANQSHLWVLPGDLHFPFGFTRRLVADGCSENRTGAKQRSFDEDNRPDDALTVEELKQLIDEKLAETKEGEDL
jgi:hypothetical protein